MVRVRLRVRVSMGDLWLTNEQACFYAHPGVLRHLLLLPGTHFLSSLCPVGTYKFGTFLFRA